MRRISNLVRLTFLLLFVCKIGYNQDGTMKKYEMYNSAYHFYPSIGPTGVFYYAGLYFLNWDSATSKDLLHWKITDFRPERNEMTLGNSVIAYSDGEIFSYIGLKVKNESPLTNTIFAELAYGKGPGYVPDDAAYGEQTFQVLNALDKEGCAERTIVNGIYDTVTEYFTGF